MALNLSGLFHTNVSDTSARTVVTQSETKAEGTGRTQAEVQAGKLELGQTINGEIVGKNGEDIQIRIARDVVINAKMEQDIRVSAGQNVLFEVRSNSSGIIALRPLFQNMAQETTALKALAQAGIDAGERSLQMVYSMMEEGMSVDRDALQGMYKQVMGMPDADIPAMVQLNRLQIPVTPESLQQFAAYKNYEHQLISSLSQVAEEIPQAVADIFAAGGMEEGNAFIGRLLDIFQGEDSHAGLPENMTGVSEKEANPQGDMAAVMTEEEDAAQSGNTIFAEAEGAEQSVMPGNGSVIGAGRENPELSEAEGSMAGKTEQKEQLLAGRSPERSDQVIPAEDREQLAALVKKAGGSEQMMQQIRQGEMGKDELYQIVRELSSHAGSQEAQAAVKELFLSGGFQKILQDRIANQWTLTEPESVEKREVAKLYERLNEQTRQLTQALSEAVKADSPLAKSVQNIRENVDFMNQVNQMYAYVQLPLKFKGKNAHGDLYVYTNKRNLAKKNGSVSAFLHLDMAHLGMVDVYVTMEQGRVGTNFYLADEDSLELLEKHIGLLTDRLTKKGYRSEAKVMLKEEPGNVMEEIIKTDKNISVISEQSFDVRA